MCWKLSDYCTHYRLLLSKTAKRGTHRLTLLALLKALPTSALLNKIMSEYIHQDDAYEWLQDKQIQFAEDDFAKVQAERDSLIKNKDDMEQQMYAKDSEIDDLEEQARRMELRFQYLLSEIARLEGEHARGL